MSSRANVNSKAKMRIAQLESQRIDAQRAAEATWTTYQEALKKLRSIPKGEPHNKAYWRQLEVVGHAYGQWSIAQSKLHDLIDID